MKLLRFINLLQAVAVAAVIYTTLFGTELDIIRALLIFLVANSAHHTVLLTHLLKVRHEHS